MYCFVSLCLHCKNNLLIFQNKTFCRKIKKNIVIKVIILKDSAIFCLQKDNIRKIRKKKILFYVEAGESIFERGDE